MREHTAARCFDVVIAMKSGPYTNAHDVYKAQQSAKGGVLERGERLKAARFPPGGRAMQMKKLFKILVVGGSALAVLAGAGCGGSSNPSNSSQLNSDGGMDGGGVHGW